MQTEKVVVHIVGWLRNYAEQSNMNGFVVGISGGVDSAVTSALCARTGLKTLCVEMPIHQAESQIARAQEHIRFLQDHFPNVMRECVELTRVFDEFKEFNTNEFYQTGVGIGLFGTNYVAVV